MTVTAPRGFVAAGVAAGLKPDGQLDVALVVNQGPSWAAAGVLTSNRIHAAPVDWTRQVLSNGQLRAVLLNSAGANACTGPDGLTDAATSAERVAGGLGIRDSDVAVCSTGPIGVRLAMPELLAGVDEAINRLSPEGGPAAAQAIITTDTHPKTVVAQGAGYTIGGMAKGAGMLAPGLATMLVVLTTDADIAPDRLPEHLRAATRVTFDRIDSDGCMSTNDTVLLLASGASGVRPTDREFTDLLTRVCDDLARQLIGDAEGAEHDIAVQVVHAASVEDALEVGRSIARNNLFKCAIFGHDANWARALAAVGTTEASFDPSRIDLAINGVQLCRGSAPWEPGPVDLGPRQVDVVVDLHAGSAQATILTNDLTYGYVRENAEYYS